MEMKVILSSLLRTFDFADAGKDIRVRLAPTFTGKVGEEVGVVPLNVRLVT